MHRDRAVVLDNIDYSFEGSGQDGKGFLAADGQQGVDSSQAVKRIVKRDRGYCFYGLDCVSLIGKIIDETAFDEFEHVMAGLGLGNGQFVALEGERLVDKFGKREAEAHSVDDMKKPQ